MPRRFGSSETWCRREEFARPGFGVVNISESVGSPCVGEVKALIGFAYPHDEARRGSAAEHLLNLSDAVDDVVEFWRVLPGSAWFAELW